MTRDIKKFVHNRNRLSAARLWGWHGCRFAKFWLFGLVTGNPGETVPYSKRMTGSFRCAWFWLTSRAKVCACGDYYIGGKECGNCQYGIPMEDRE